MSARWSRVEAVVRDALSHAAGDREAFVEAACGDDQSLRAEVRSLLAQETAAQSFLEQPVIAAGGPMIGRQLGPYRIVGHLGAGGMGEVYRARDTRLERDVAIKVLPASLASDPDRLARLGREARLLAAVNHPHIAAIHGIEEADGIRALVLELVDGETLASRIERGALPIPEALRLAVQLADALAAAHDKGIVHRDFKPGNIQLDARGAKVLDFGIARGTTTESGGTTVATLDGSVIGTPAYMSPEQARGEAVDRQTDVWAFGCVLFEMLSGARAFPGATTSDVLVAVLDRDPAWSSLPPATPAPVLSLIRRCLQKDQARRLRDMGDVRLLVDQPDAGQVTSPAPASSSKMGRFERLGWIAITAVLASLAVILPSWRRGESTPLPSHLVLPLKDGTDFVNGIPFLGLSPDGRTLIYGARIGIEKPWLYMRRLDSLVATVIPGTLNGTHPAVSPDGQWLAFFDGSKLKKVRLDGGTPQELGNFHSGTLTWQEPGAILFGEITDAAGGGLRRVAADGGATTTLSTVDRAAGHTHHALPQLLPDGKTLLFTIRANPESGPRYHLAVQPLAGGPARIVLEDAAWGRYLDDGTLLYQRASSLFATRFDPERLVVDGRGTAFIDGVELQPSRPAWDYRADTLVYMPAVEQLRALVWVTRDGTSRPVGAPPGDYGNPRVSPGGDRIAMTVRVGVRTDVVVFDLQRERLERLTSDGQSRMGAWLPDGTRVIITRRAGAQENLFIVRADGVGDAEQITRDGHTPYADRVTRDGRTLIFGDSDPESGRGYDLWIMELGQPRTAPRPLIQTEALDAGGRLDPSERWLSYATNESASDAVKVTAFPGGGARKVVSTAAGREPVWGPKDDELFYRNGDQMMVVRFDPSQPLEFGKPQKLFEGHYSSQGGPGNIQYDIAPDGRFLMLQNVARGDHFNVIQGVRALLSKK